MGEDNNTTGGMSRRDVIKKSVVAGGLVWATPTLLSSSIAGAEHNCLHCENNGVLYHVKIASASSANCGSHCVDLKGRYDSGPGVPRCGKCLFDVGAVQFVETEHFSNGQIRKAQVIVDPRLRVVETGAQFKGSCYLSACDTNFVQNPVPGPHIIFTQVGVQPSPPNNPGQTTIIDYEATQAVDAPINQIDPLNFVGLVLCFPAGGTDFPGC